MRCGRYVWTAVAGQGRRGPAFGTVSRLYCTRDFVVIENAAGLSDVALILFL